MGNLASGCATSSEIILIESSTLLSLLSSRMLSRVVLALLLIDPAASLVLPVSSPASHGVRRAPAPVAFDLKKMCAPQFARASAILNLAYSVARIADAAPTRRRFDPEGAMERGVRLSPKPIPRDFQSPDKMRTRPGPPLTRGPGLQREL